MFTHTHTHAHAHKCAHMPHTRWRVLALDLVYFTNCKSFKDKVFRVVQTERLINLDRYRKPTSS